MKHDRDPLMPRAPGGMGRGLMLALLVHALLVVGLAIGVNWRVSNPEGMQAELWAAVPQVAAPRAAAPEPPPPKPERPTPRPEPPKPAPPPKPKPKPEPAPEPEPAKVLPDPQIAIEQAKREERERRQAEQREQEQLKKEAARKLAEKKLELAKAEAAAKALEAEKAAKAKEKAEVAAKAEALEKEKKRKEEELRQARIEEAKEKAEAKRVADNREDALKRMLSQAGGSTGEVGSTGTAAQNAAPSDSYAGRVKARVKPNIVFVDQLTSNPQAEVLVRLAPDGRIISQKLVRSSGSAEWDQAVQRAIDRTEILPRDVDGRVPSSMLIAFKPRE